MIQTQNMKYLPLFNPISKTAAASASGTVDTRGSDDGPTLTRWATEGTNPTRSVLVDGSPTDWCTNVPAFIGDDTTTGFTIPAADTDDPQVVKFEVDLSKRRRYLELAVTAGATQVMSAIALLHKGSRTPNIDAESGCSEIVIG